MVALLLNQLFIIIIIITSPFFSLHPHIHTETMDKLWMKEKIHKCFLLIQSRPFILLILLVIVMSTILRIITPCFLVFASLITATCVALQTGDFLGFVSRTGEIQPGLHVCKECSVSLHIHAQKNCDHAFLPPSTSWKYRLMELLRQVCRSSVVFMKMHIFWSDLRKEDLYGKGVEFEKQRIATEYLSKDSKLLKIQLGAKNGLFTDDLGHDESVLCTQRSLDMVVSDGKVRPLCVCPTHHEGEVGDVPELEDCSTSSEEEEVCKQVLETNVHSTNSHRDIAVEANAMLEPTNVSEAAMMRPSEDEQSIDKHQILPLEGCKQCKNLHCKDADARDVSSGRIRKTYTDGKKLEITDADLQNAASEFFTLEGDVLWSETDVKKQSHSAGASVVPTTCEFCKQEGEPSQSFSFFPLRASRGAKTFAHMPASSKLVYYVDAKRAQEDSGSEESVRASAEELNQDVMIDQELRAIASRSGNKGEESNYMSTAGSFRDYVGSFREFDTFWPDYDIADRKEHEYFVGCCDDHAKPCISHSRSRSKVLQTDPLLSKSSLIREQEIMDVLWQEYNEDRRQKNNHLGKQQREISQKQRSQLGVDGSGSFSEVLSEGSTAESFNVLQKDYVMKLNASADHDFHSCRFGSDKPCWSKARSYQRRRHFVGFCRLFREFGLKQCMQSSEVDN